MTRYWKFVGWTSFILALAVTAFLYLAKKDGKTSVENSASRSKPPASRFITN